MEEGPTGYPEQNAGPEEHVLPSGVGSGDRDQEGCSQDVTFEWSSSVGEILNS